MGWHQLYSLPSPYPSPSPSLLSERPPLPHFSLLEPLLVIQHPEKVLGWLEIVQEEEKEGLREEDEQLCFL